MAEAQPDNIKMFEISALGLVSLLEEDTTITTTEGIPVGARVVESGYDAERRIHYVTVAHDSFDSVDEGERIPRGTCTITSGEQ